MKFDTMVKVAVPNLVILALIWEVVQDDAGRIAYFESLGFTPSTHYYPFFYITTAVKGASYIPGLLTLDWVQVLAVVLLVLDLSYVLGYVRKQRSMTTQTPVLPGETKI
ncbi:MAG: hypothetical protein OK474_04445 [Thaumarchaeota archaeon]|nr:hypothetical protein [Nitrososphaerota archaeon]